MDTCIVLRTAGRQDRQKYVQAGGIVSDPDPVYEHRECQRFTALFRAADALRFATRAKRGQ